MIDLLFIVYNVIFLFCCTYGKDRRSLFETPELPIRLGILWADDRALTKAIPHQL
jgi:hypothetical protein